MTVAIGDVVEGRYRIIKLLGEGGMGSVFLAEHTLIQRRVAIKLLHAELASDGSVVDRFMNEARAAGTLGHPNIVESTDMGFTRDGVPYIVFEYLEGTLLTDEIYRVGGLPLRRALKIAQQIASAVHAAHAAGIVHRDLKSDNIFLTDKADALDHVKVLDFGISRFLDTDELSTRRGFVMGTPEFMAPEQIVAPEQVDRRTDIHALGVILYEMLEARRPFCGLEPLALLDRIVNDAPPPLSRADVPHGLATLITTKLLAKAPDDRLGSMVEVGIALDAFTTQSAPRADRSELIPRPAVVRDSVVELAAPRKRPWLAYGGIAAGIAVAGSVGLALGGRGASDALVVTPAPTVVLAPPPATAPVVPEKRSVTIAIAATAANARVTFRRRVAAAPLTVTIAPSDIVELVEVAAPGKKTMRYWLTFDRTTRLVAELPAGDGLVEATEEQTLVALGELAAPKPAVAAVVAAPARKIGRVEAKPKADDDRVVIVDDPKDPVEPVKPVDTKTETAIATTGTRSETTMETISETKTEAKSETNRVKLESIEPGLGSHDGTTTAKPDTEIDKKLARPIAPTDATKVPPSTIDPSVVASVVGANRPAMLKCLADGRKANPKLAGTLTLQLEVDASGAVRRTQVQSTIQGASLVAACMVKASRGWRFPTHVVATVSYPFRIQ